MDLKAVNKEPASNAVIRFQHCDPMGHLYNSRYIDYFINAREDHLAEHYGLDIFKRIEREKLAWVVVKTEIAYLAPVVFMEKVLIKTRLVQINGNALKMEGIMYDEDSRRIKSVIWINFMHFDIQAGKMSPHPDDVMGLFKSILLGGIENNIFDKRVSEIVSSHKA